VDAADHGRLLAGLLDERASAQDDRVRFGCGAEIEVGEQAQQPFPGVGGRFVVSCPFGQFGGPQSADLARLVCVPGRRQVRCERVREPPVVAARPSGERPSACGRDAIAQRRSAASVRLAGCAGDQAVSQQCLQVGSAAIGVATQQGRSFGYRHTAVGRVGNRGKHPLPGVAKLAPVLGDRGGSGIRLACHGVSLLDLVRLNM